jgi:hypothetical protein
MPAKSKLDKYFTLIYLLHINKSYEDIKFFLVKYKNLEIDTSTIRKFLNNKDKKNIKPSTRDVLEAEKELALLRTSEKKQQLVEENDNNFNTEKASIVKNDIPSEDRKLLRVPQETKKILLNSSPNSHKNFSSLERKEIDNIPQKRTFVADDCLVNMSKASKTLIDLGSHKLKTKEIKKFNNILKPENWEEILKANQMNIFNYLKKTTKHSEHVIRFAVNEVSKLFFRMYKEKIVDQEFMYFVNVAKIKCQSKEGVL